MGAAGGPIVTRWRLSLFELVRIVLHLGAADRQARRFPGNRRGLPR